MNSNESISMKTFLKKYAFALIPLFLCVLMISIRPAYLKAEACTDENGDTIPCGTSANPDTETLQPNPEGSSAADTSATAGGTAGTPAGSNTNLGGGTLTGNGNPLGGGTVTGNGNPVGGGTVNPSSGGTFYLQNPLSSQFTTVGGIVGGFIQIFVYLVVLFAVVMIIYVGLMLVLAQGNTEELTKRKDQLLMLVIGLAIVIGARIIVQVVISTLQSTGTVNQNVITNAQNALKSQ
jgi:hypothetical protein